MESQPPPGYNPNSSLLNGGTTPILPVQGGGFQGGLPDDYNATQSLLDVKGGSDIVPISGGSYSLIGGETEVEKAMRLAKEAQEQRKREMVAKLSKSYMLEDYSIVPSKQETLNYDVPFRTALLKKYKSYLAPLLQDACKEFTKPSDPTLTQRDPPRPRLMNSGQPTLIDSMPRRIQVIKEKSPSFFIVPGIEGRVDVLTSVLTQIKDTIKESTYLLFLPPLYGNTTNPLPNLFILNKILDLKTQYPNRVYALNNLSKDSIAISQKLLKNMYSDTYAPKKEYSLPLFLEPDILVFTGPKIVFRNGPLPQSESGVNAGNVVGMMEKIHTLPSSFLIKPSAKDTTSFKTYHADFLCDGTKGNLGTGTTDCPGYTCETFKGGYKLDSIRNPIKLGGELYYLGISNGQPLFKTPKVTSAITPTSSVEPASVPPNINFPENVEEEEISTNFKEDPTATNKESTVPFEFNMKQFSIREATKGKDDWSKGKFTQGEADFLNTLRLTKALLQHAFGIEWPKKVGEFFETLAISKCFQEYKLILSEECDVARRFLQTIQKQLYLLTLQKMVKGPIKLNETSTKALTEISEGVKALSLITKLIPEGVQDLSGNNFEGDFEVPHVNKSGRNFIDFINTNDITARQKIRNLKAQLSELRKTGKVKRIYGKNRNNVTKKYTKYQSTKFPLPPTEPEPVESNRKPLPPTEPEPRPVASNRIINAEEMEAKEKIIRGRIDQIKLDIAELQESHLEALKAERALAIRIVKAESNVKYEETNETKTQLSTLQNEMKEAKIKRGLLEEKIRVKEQQIKDAEEEIKWVSIKNAEKHFKQSTLLGRPLGATRKNVNQKIGTLTKELTKPTSRGWPWHKDKDKRRIASEIKKLTAEYAKNDETLRNEEEAVERKYGPK